MSRKNRGDQSKKVSWVAVIAVILIISGLGNLKRMTGFGIGCIVVGVLLLTWKNVLGAIVAPTEKKETGNSAPEDTPLPAAPAAPDAAPAPSARPVSRVRTVNSREYTDVRLYHPAGLKAVPEIGDSVEFELDPENPYDAEAIAAWADVDGEMQIVAYFNRNKLREMVRDWLNDPSRGDISAVVTKVEPRNVTVDITFEDA